MSSSKKNITITEIKKQIEVLNEIFRDSRAYYPYIPDEFVGKSPEFTFNKAYTKVYYSYNHTITKEEQLYNNKIAHFLNQNFIVRLYAVLQYFGIYDNIDSTLTGYYELDILKRLRNKFGHGIGHYNKNNSKDKKLMKDIVNYFPLEKKEYSDFPINIDIVIGKIITASKQYCEAMFKKSKSKAPNYLKLIFIAFKSFFLTFNIVYNRLKKKF